MIHPTELRVINLIAENPNRKWYFLYPDDVSYSQYKYWAKKLVSEGLAKEIHHGNNRYNSWVGYVMLKNIRDIELHRGDIPF